MTAVAVAAAVVTGLWRDNTWRAVMVLGAVGVVTILVAWNGDGEEVARHTVEGLAEVHLCVLIAATVGVLTVIPRRRRRPPGAGVGAVGSQAVARSQAGARSQAVEQ